MEERKPRRYPQQHTDGIKNKETRKTQEVINYIHEIKTLIADPTIEEKAVLTRLINQ